MILTTTLNAAIDKRYVVSSFREGEVNRVTSCTCTPGGKGLNVAKPAAIYGSKVIATGFAGGYAGKYIEDRLQPLGIESRFYHVAEESRSCINIWNESRKEQTEFLEPGFTVSGESFEEFKRQYRELADEADVAEMSGSVPQGLGPDAYQDLIGIVRAAGKPVILDTSGELLKAGLKACPTMVKPNIDEIRALTGTQCGTTEELIQAARQMQEAGVELVAISLGKDGSLLSCRDGVYRAAVPQIEAVNTVGCGDSMVAGFAIGLEQKMAVPDMLRLASAISAASAMREETGYFRMSDMRELLPRITIEKIC